jgi:23S rRNA (uracil1939-C5)-methyltransferase
MSHSVEFKKIASDGKALGYLDDKACFCVGPLPGETALVETVKSKPTFTEAMLSEITQASVHRGEAREEHYQLCSPWQGVDYAYQLELKRGMLAEVFERPQLRLEIRDLVPSPEQFNYRNKLEFALLVDAGKRIRLAFHARGSEAELLPLETGCVLGSVAMNNVALKILERLNRLNISGYVESLTVRESQTDGKILAVVGLHQKATRDWSELKINEAAGVIVSRVRPGHMHETLWYDGEKELSEKMGGVELRYPYDGFFQTNMPAFEQALRQIMKVVPRESRVADLYCGVGTIGLSVAPKVRSVIGVEINTGALAQAEANAVSAGLANYTAVAESTERMPSDVLKGVDVVIVDPPRAGLGHRVLDMLLEAAPGRVIYLSCNPVTQARDIMMFAGKYRASGVTGFDFYPGTLHLESLVVLDRI